MRGGIFIVLLLALASGAFAYGVLIGPLGAEDAAKLREDAQFYNALGYALSQEEKSLEAQAAFAKAVDLDGSYENARSNLATIAFKNNDYVTAIQHLRVLVADNPQNAAYAFDLAQNLASQARYVDADLDKLREAATLFDAAQELMPGFPHAADNARIVRDVVAEFS